jgi:two-component system CheB/CheR fusion protein
MGPMQQMHPPAAHGPRLAGVRLLVVEDSPDAAEALDVLLQFEGAAVHVAHDGHAALALLRTQPLDFVVSDLGMPGLDGYGLIAALRAEEPLRHLPCIALTGHGQEADVQRALAAGFDAHVTKPVVLDELIARILQVLEPRRA